MKPNGILNAKNLIEKRKLIEEKKRREFIVEIDELGAFKFRTPDAFDIIDSLEFKNGGYEDEFIIYSCMLEPNPKDTDLHEAFGCSEPFDIIDAIFLPGEKQRVAQILSEKAGFHKDVAKVVDEVKN